MSNIGCTLLSIPKTNDLLHTQLDPTKNNALADRFSLIFVTNTTLMTQQFS